MAAKAVAGKAPTRRTQEERSNTTRGLLLDATIECLIERGYSATTTTVIAERAGVSRGAQLHHYPTKAELVAAAVEHLARKIGTEFATEVAKLGRGDNRLTAAIDVLWARYESPLFEAWLELAVAARTDGELRASLAPVEDRLRLGIQHMARDSFGVEADGEGQFSDLVQLTFHLLQGLAVERSILNESRKARDRREQQALRAWKGIVAERLSVAR